MNDAQGEARPTTPSSRRRVRMFRKTAGSVLAMATVLTSAVVALPGLASGDQLSDAKTKAAQIEATISQTSSKITALNEQYNGAKYHLDQLNAQIDSTKAEIDKAKAQVGTDTVKLRDSVINAYINAGTQATSNPLFATNQKNYVAAAEYGRVASDHLSSDLANLTNAQDYLKTQQSQLQVQQSSVQTATNQTEAALSQAKGLQSQMDAALGQVNGQIADLIKQQQAAEKAAQLAAFHSAVAASNSGSGSGGGGGGGGGGQNLPAPPPTPGAAGAVAAAQSQLGTPYVWGGSQPGGFDCSGLIMWAWGRAGVNLPHFSGAQMAATTPVPFSAIQPGDILFYGPGGSEHEGMYVGGGMMVEATHTGDFVRDDPVRMDFAGIGRPY